MAYSTSGAIGPNISLVSTTPKFGIGYETESSDGQLWLYVVAGQNISAGDSLAINKTWQAFQLTAARVAAGGGTYGVAQVAISASSYGFVCINGANISASFSPTVSAGMALGISPNTSGALALYSTTSQIQIGGIMASQTVAASAQGLVIMNNPHFILPRN